MRENKLRSLSVIAALIYLGACASPAERFDQTAATLGLQRTIVTGTQFKHVLFWREEGPNRILHIYLGGDGIPSISGQPAKDPTPRNPLMLRLLELDPGPAVYIGRPCYHGFAVSEVCSSRFWTTARYSEQVVSSLAAAIRRIMTVKGYDRISLFGYSGGGTLAMLLAERIENSKAVITIAANLDIDAWTDHHGQPRLTASLNPAVRPPLRDSVLQRHYFGSRDYIVPATIAAGKVQGSDIQFNIIDGFDHVCCWNQLWPRILSDITAGVQ